MTVADVMGTVGTVTYWKGENVNTIGNIAFII